MESEEPEIELETVFCDIQKQAQMARALKAGVYGQHKRIKKTRTRLYEIFHPQHAKPHR